MSHQQKHIPHKDLCHRSSKHLQRDFVCGESGDHRGLQGNPPESEGPYSGEPCSEGGCYMYVLDDQKDTGQALLCQDPPRGLVLRDGPA